MSEEFTLRGSKPTEFELDMTITDEEAFKRLFEPPSRQSLRMSGLKTRTQRPCPTCDKPIDGWTLDGVTVAPGERTDTFEVTGESVTFSPCGHERRIANGDDEPPALEAS